MRSRPEKLVELRARTRAILFLSLVIVAPVVAQGEAPISFGREIRPLLSDRCFACHGPDRAHRKAGLRLDLATGATAVRKGRQAIVPGHPERSEVMRRLTATDPGDRMPPPKSHKTVSAEEVDLLKRWIREGAKYEDHWSYRPLSRVATEVRAESAEEMIDHWLAARRRAVGLQANTAADRVTLIRRVSFDLHGLPPTPDEVEAFVGDSRSDAYARLVDRLLASPRYGERMAMYWLDLVRYADTVGYHGDQEHPIAPYRDYVIRAFHTNKPFDRFTVEQLAGDLLPDPTEEQRVATGYNRVLQTTHEGGAQAKEYLAIYAADRVRNFSSVWMGATLGCAQCHDHKYDPYLARDFYAMAAFFAGYQGARRFPGQSESFANDSPPGAADVGWPLIGKNTRPPSGSCVWPVRRTLAPRVPPKERRAIG